MYCRMHNIFAWYALNITKYFNFYSKNIALLFATILLSNKPKRQPIPTRTLSHVKILRVIFSLFWFTISILVSIQRTHGVLEKTTEHA